jgi:tRNA-specific 2-thiouridylase
MAKPRVIAAMSGGVDSCVAAALLIEQGFEVIGITMQLWNQAGNGEERFDSCCSLTDVHDARLSAHRLGIPHYVVNYEREFKKGVVDYFASEYGEGRTPNPCVLCNSKLKFDHLVDRAKALGADWVATGHYARVLHFEDGRPSELLTGLDSRKDQSYFLFDMRPDNLKRAMFPLGGMTKPEVRQVAAGLGLHTAEKHESQEICFVSGRRYTDFLEQHYPEVTGKVGEIVDRAGNVLGKHEGIHLFTVGQRKGLGDLGSFVPKYVASIDAASGRVVVDDLENLAVESFSVERPNWLVLPEDLSPDRVLSVMVRYRAKPVACRVIQDGARVKVLLAEPARWVTPGQAAVFYDRDRVIGGGFIASQAASSLATGRLQPTLGGASAPTGAS